MEEMRQFIENRPEVKGAYGYGSGVFKQSGYTKKDKPQIDFIFVVEDLKKWHLENMKRNPKDYSMMGKWYYTFAKEDSLKKQTGIAYLSSISFQNSIYKYGTIEEADLLNYLETWESFYLPGRFQKTLLPIIPDDRVDKANLQNRENALYTALLTLPNEQNHLIDLYAQLCGLSYLGDTRMKFAENPRKVLNIVEGSFEEFVAIYGKENAYFQENQDGLLTIQMDALLADIDRLPSALLSYIKDVIETKDPEQIRAKILEYFTLLNKKESMIQTKRGICTNGVTRSIKYASAKVLKKIKH